MPLRKNKSKYNRKNKSKYNRKHKGKNNKKNRNSRLKKRRHSKRRSKKRRRKSRCKRSRKVYRKKKSKRGYRGVQMGCAKQRGGAANCVDYNCEYPSNMGSIITGTKYNLQGSDLQNADLIPRTTQNHFPALPPKQTGGGLFGFDGLGTSKLIDFGLSHPLTTMRNSMNYLYDFKNTWDADRQVASADPIVAHKMDNS